MARIPAITIHAFTDRVITAAFEKWLDDFKNGKCYSLTKKELKKKGVTKLSEEYKETFLHYTREA